MSEKAGLEKEVARVTKELEESREENQLLKKARPEPTLHVPATPAVHRCGCTDRVFLAEVERKRLADELCSLRDQKDRLKIENIDFKQEVMELKSKMDHKDKEMIVLSKELMEMAAKLEIAEVNLAQLRSASKGPKDENGENADDIVDRAANESKETQADANGKVTPATENALKEKESEIFRLTLENDEHAKRVAELTAYIQHASQDREQIIHQYTSYSQQLATQIETLTQQLEIKASENKDFATREADLVSHVQRLEAQLQKTIQQGASNPFPSGEAVAVSFKEVEILQEKGRDLDAKLTNVVVEREMLQTKLQQQTEKMRALEAKLTERETVISDLETKLDIVSEKNTMMDMSQQESLVAAMSSDKVAASRAIKQNKQLKDQVEELENAIMQVVRLRHFFCSLDQYQLFSKIQTNSKAALMNEYTTMKARSTQLEEDEASLKIQVQGLQEAVKEKDRSVNRMRDQMKYYIAFAENSIHGRLDSGQLKDAHGESNESGEDQLHNMIEELHNAKVLLHMKVKSSRT